MCGSHSVSFGQHCLRIFLNRMWPISWGITFTSNWHHSLYLVLWQSWLSLKQTTNKQKQKEGKGSEEERASAIIIAPMSLLPCLKFSSEPQCWVGLLKWLFQPEVAAPSYEHKTLSSGQKLLSHSKFLSLFITLCLSDLVYLQNIFRIQPHLTTSSVLSLWSTPPTLRPWIIAVASSLVSGFSSYTPRVCPQTEWSF